jgi:class 3 adenylate cyclase
MFTDVQGFTTIGEALDPMELTQIASAYFEEVTHELLAAGATIDKYTPTPREPEESACESVWARFC